MQLRHILWLIVLGTATAACSGNDVKQTLGLKRNNPDAFQVVSRPPLSVPPMYHLRPPSDGPVDRGVSAEATAESMLLGREAPTAQVPLDPAMATETAVVPVSEGALGSTGEANLLSSAGAGAAKSDIRALIHEETVVVEEEKEDESLVEKLQIYNPDSSDPVVDAKGEAGRLETNKTAGKPLNEGNVPVKDPKDESVLDKLFK